MKAYLLKIRGGVEVDSNGNKAGKGPLIQEEVSATLGTNQDQYLFQPVVYAIENHPNDSRCRIDESGKCQALTSRMGTGGNNVPMVMFSKVRRAKDTEDFETWTESKVTNTLNTFDQGDVRATDVICKVIDTSHADDVIRVSDKAPTLTDRIYKGGICVLDPIAIDRAAFNQGENAKYDFQIGGGYSTNRSCERSGSGVLQKAVGALCHDDYKFPQQQQIEQGKYIIERTNDMDQEYIVRRLTPLECCRLQGFPDGWGEIDPKDDFTDEEYRFWLEVRNTYAKVNGKQTKDYTKEQMLTWYNKLHTDSAEYKMWGNGIALPNALYVMQGIADELGKGVTE